MLEEKPFLASWTPLHIPRAGAPPQDLAFKVPETGILEDPHNPGDRLTTQLCLSHL